MITMNSSWNERSIENAAGSHEPYASLLEDHRVPVTAPDPRLDQTPLPVLLQSGPAQQLRLDVPAAFEVLRIRRGAQVLKGLSNF